MTATRHAGTSWPTVLAVAAAVVVLLVLAEVVYLGAAAAPGAPLLWMTVGTHAGAAATTGYLGAVALNLRRGPPAEAVRRGLRRNVTVFWNLGTLFVVLGWFAFTLGASLSGTSLSGTAPSNTALPGAAVAIAIVPPALLIGYGGAAFVLLSRALRY